MTAEVPSAYPPYAVIRERRLVARRAAAIQALRLADKLARDAGGRLLVFGSLAEGGFHERSDLDVALMGVRPPADSRLAVEIELLLADAGFAADVVPERFLPHGLVVRVKAHGREPSSLG